MGGIFGGTDKLSRIAWLQSDPALAEILGVEAMVSQPTLLRFFRGVTQKASSQMAQLHGWAAYGLPSLQEGDTMDLDSWALLYEDGHQEGVATGRC